MEQSNTQQTASNECNSLIDQGKSISLDENVVIFIKSVLNDLESSLADHGHKWSEDMKRKLDGAHELLSGAQVDESTHFRDILISPTEKICLFIMGGGDKGVCMTGGRIYDVLSEYLDAHSITNPSMSFNIKDGASKSPV